MNKKERRKGRILAWILSVAMVCSMVSVPGKVKAESVSGADATNSGKPVYVEFEKASSTSNYDQYNVMLHNNTGGTISDWTITVVFQSDPGYNAGWNGVSYDSGAKTMTIQTYGESSWNNATIYNGQSAGGAGFQVRAGALDNAAITITYSQGESSEGPATGEGGGGTGGSSVTDTTTNKDLDVEYNYAKLLQESLYFYDANMCGKLEGKCGLSWRGNCHTYDANVTTTINGVTYQVDVSGGFHDAGDHVKFGLPQGYAATMLEMSYYEFPDAYEDNGLTAHLKTITDYFCDYFKRCTVYDSSKKVVGFCYQVGEGNSDHDIWSAPETQTLNRPAYFATASNPATDEVSVAIAALAMNYINFGNTEDLQTAKDLFTFVQNNSKACATEGASGFYNSASWQDDYALAASALWIATGEAAYKSVYDANKSGINQYWVLDWANSGAMAAMLAGDSATLASITDVCKGTPTIDGLFNCVLDWGSCRYNTASQFTGLVYDKLTNSGKYTEWATSQMNYIIGDNPNKRCYIVGYNENSSQYPHHRAASRSNNAGATNSDHYTLLGALVGGPGQNGYYKDDQNDYNCNEVALDYNAGLVGAAAALYHVHKNDTSIYLSYEKKTTTNYSTALATDKELSAVGVTIFYSGNSQPTATAELTASQSTVSCASQVYGYGSASPQTVTLTNSGDGAAENVKAALKTGTAFMVSLSGSSIAAGQNAILTITPKAGLSAGAYEDMVTVSYGAKKLEIAVSFTVTPQQVTSVTFPTASAITTIDTLSKSILTGGATQYGTFAWVNANQKLGAGSQSADVVLTLNAAAKQNYNFGNVAGCTYNSAAGTLTKAVSVTVNKAAAPAITFPAASSIQYGQKLSASTLTGGSTQYGTFAWENGNEVMSTVGTVSKNVVFTPNDTQTYNWDAVNKTSKINITVTKANRTDVPAAAVLTTRTANSITVQSVAGCQYSRDGGITWQSSNVFTGLSPFTAYQVTVRYAESDVYYAGGAAASVTMYTLVEDPYTIDVSKLNDGNYVAALCSVDGTTQKPTVTYTNNVLTLLDGREINGTGYILTGSNPDLTVKTSADTDITLQNATMKKLEIVNASATGTKITLSGVNTVSQGITSTGRLTICGEGHGSLTIHADTVGIQASELIIQSGVLEITAGKTALSADQITITGGMVTAAVTNPIAGDSVIKATDSITLTGGSIATNKPESSNINDFGVDAGGKIIVDGNVSIAGTPAYSVIPTDAEGNVLKMVTVTLQDENGAVLSTLQVNAGGAVVLSDLNVKAADGATNYADSKIGYALGWVYNGVTYDLTGTIANVSTDITLAAVWTRIVLDISGAAVLVNGNYIYTGMAQTPTVQVVYNGKTLTAGTDYDAVYSNNINAGTAAVIITGKNGYKGTATASFTIAAKSIAGLGYGALGALEYTGAALMPAVKVTDGAKTLTQGVDYLVSYSNNINPGTATVNVTGKGNYTGSKILTFTIAGSSGQAKKSVENLTVSAIGAQPYTGKAVTPVLTISDGSRVLTSGVDYTVVYQNNIKVGTANAVISGQGDYTGMKTVSFQITIKKNALYTVGNFQYKVTKDATMGTGTVSLVKVVKKKASVTIAATVKIGGISFKVTEIGASAFKGNTKLTTLKIGKNVTKIGANAFYGCTKLKTATLGAGVKTIGKKAFYNCKAMTKLTISSTKLTKKTVGAGAFTKMGAKNYKKLTVKVPKSKLKAYKTLLKSKGLSKKATVKK